MQCSGSRKVLYEKYPLTCDCGESYYYKPRHEDKYLLDKGQRLFCFSVVCNLPSIKVEKDHDWKDIQSPNTEEEAE